MKKLHPLLILSVIIGCSTTIDFKINFGKKDFVGFNSLLERGGMYYEINSEKPFSGFIIDKYESGQHSMEGFIKEGSFNGNLTKWYKNGQKSYEGTYENGKVISKELWNEDGSVRE